MTASVRVIIIVSTVVALVAGPALAFACSGPQCAMAMRVVDRMRAHAECDTVCPDEAGASISGRCTMRPESQQRDVAAGEKAPRGEAAVPAVAPVPAPPIPQARERAVPGSDARGAPHLVTVIRI